MAQVPAPSLRAVYAIPLGLILYLALSFPIVSFLRIIVYHRPFSSGNRADRDLARTPPSKASCCGWIDLALVAIGTVCTMHECVPSAAFDFLLDRIPYPGYWWNVHTSPSPRARSRNVVPNAVLFLCPKPMIMTMMMITHFGSDVRDFAASRVYSVNVV